LQPAFACESQEPTASRRSAAFSSESSSEKSANMALSWAKMAWVAQFFSVSMSLRTALFPLFGGLVGSFYGAGFISALLLHGVLKRFNNSTFSILWQKF
jgi:hypothetical protein